jgi:hypothetical protein
MKDLFKLSTLFIVAFSIVVFFAVLAPARTEKSQTSKSVPVFNANYEVQSLVKTYELTECFDTGSFDDDVCCAH